MFDSEYSMDVFKSVKISIRTVMKNPEMLRFIFDHLRTKKNVKACSLKIGFCNKIYP